MTKKYKTSVELEEDFSYEVRFYCDFCDEEVAEDEQKQHAKECEQRNQWNCEHNSIDPKSNMCRDCGVIF